MISRHRLDVVHGELRIKLVEMEVTDAEFDWWDRLKSDGINYAASGWNAVAAIQFKRDWEQICKQLRGEQG